MIRRLASALAASAALSVIAGSALAQSTPAAPTTPLLASDQWRTVAPEDLLVIDTSKGRITVALDRRMAPAHVDRIQTLARQNFYDGLKFHRVIAGFMAQTGDPTGTGTGGSKLGKVKAEFTPTPFERGTVGAARSASPDSADSQFFICFTHTPFLNGQYTVWGKVVDGMTHVDNITKGEPPANPDKIVKMYVMADAAKAAAPAAAQPAPAVKK